DNVSHYSSAEFDAKLDEARKTVDEDARIKLMHEADAIGAEDMPIIPILHKALNKVGSDKFQDLMVDAGRTPELRYAKLA
ncbi:MAG: peptide ABC transporter substrate-binding protein, partial [Olsenella sp.]